MKCTQLESASTKREYEALSKEFGINHRSILDELQYFDVCGGGLVQDVMHDALEGMLEYECKMLLRHLIESESYFSLEYLNHQISSMELGYMEVKDRPSIISINTLKSSDHNLKQQGIKLISSFTNYSKCTYQTAAQMWLLGRLLPVMVGKKVPQDDDYWTNFTDLLTIMDLLLSPELTEDDVANMSTLILDHHIQFCVLYPSSSVIPKMHYLIHMPRLILE